MRSCETHMNKSTKGLCDLCFASTIIVDAKPSKKVKQIKENASPVTESIINRVPINAQMWKMKKMKRMHSIC